MAKSPTNALADIIALATQMAASSTGGLMLTQAEGQDIVAGGFATVDATVVDGDKAFVSLTPAGEALVAAPTVPVASTAPAVPVAPVAPAGKPVLVSDIPIPTKNRRGRAGGGLYPLESMEVGQSFHISTTAENPDPVARIASSLTNARTKFAVPAVPAATETVKVRVYKRGDDGKVTKNAEGHRIVESETEETREVTVLTRDWVVAGVDANDPGGVGARVWRVT